MWWHCLIIHITERENRKVRKEDCLMVDCYQSSLWRLDNWEKVISHSVHIYCYSTACWYALTGIWKCERNIFKEIWTEALYKSSSLANFLRTLRWEREREIEYEREGELAWHVSVGVDGTNWWKSWSTHLFVGPGRIVFIFLNLDGNIDSCI